MENHKKNYLFRLGPLIFFPKDTEEKPPIHKSNEGFQNTVRFLIILIYGQLSYYLTKTYDVGSMFTEKNPLSYYVIFAVPFIFSLMDVYMIWLEKKTKIPMNKISHYFIYGAWIVSAFYYSIYIYKGLFN